ncbi:HAD-IIIC family phosphatase [Frisingicoccus sp.]|uniref:HAD-IIIC family phosphatase n=1 Tax=Frisingicoccus sp. TaxID=1918627 RepID=UPI0025C0CDBD|nr:HAD-IIIC family phosphatase [Frisingicoccus sp.]
MYQFDKIKLVIWDLDDTFWVGTFSEGEIIIPDICRKLIERLTDIGVVNSICSKNDWEPIKERLKEEKLLDYFVFSSVNWEAKGNRVKQLIKDMQLRSANVLFLDDNPSNREEVRYFCPDIMTEGPEIIPHLLEDTMLVSKLDLEHKRLAQYRILEEKRQEKAQYSSNEAFLMKSNICVKIEHNCQEQIERIHDLILRSNQLNFTKVRSSMQELEGLLNDPMVETGYVSVTDRFGDYGIVGFYALKDGALAHFVFSCRTLGMGIEQYTYHYLNRPKLNIIGEVISDLSSEQPPKWINQNVEAVHAEKMKIRSLHEHMVLVKGPCDLFQIYPYIAQTELFDTEFTYTTDTGLVVESAGHTTNIVEAYRLSEVQKKCITDELPFVDIGMYSDKIFKNPYKVVFISILTDANLGVYQRKQTGERFAFMEYLYPLTDPNNWDAFIAGKYNCCGFHFTREILEQFSQQYEYIGRNSPERIVENLKFIKGRLKDDCILVVMLGGELYYEKNAFEAYKDRHIVHKRINDAIREWAASTDGIQLMDVNRYLTGQSCFYDHFNHYVKPVYYKLAEDMVRIVNECTGSSIKETSKIKMIQIRIKEFLAPIYYKLRGLARK